jgi:hypothetical protein
VSRHDSSSVPSRQRRRSRAGSPVLPLQAKENDGIVLARNGPPAPGTTVDISHRSEAKLTIKVQVKDREGSKDGTITVEKQSRLTVVSPSKLQFEITGTKKTGGSSSDAPAPSPLEGKPLVIEKKGDQWAIHKEDGSELSKEEHNNLTGVNPVREMEADWLIFGGAAHKPGDQWQVDVSKLSVFASLDHPTGTVAVEFVEVTKVDGVDCATIKMKIDAEGTSASTGMNIHLKAEETEHRSLADLMPLDEKVTGTMECSGKTAAGNDFHGSGTLEDTTTKTIHHS